MRNEDLKTFIKGVIDQRDIICKAHGDELRQIKKDMVEIKVELTKITTAYKVFVFIGTVVGTVTGFIVNLLWKKI